MAWWRWNFGTAFLVHRAPRSWRFRSDPLVLQLMAHSTNVNLTVGNFAGTAVAAYTFLAFERHTVALSTAVCSTIS